MHALITHAADQIFAAGYADDKEEASTICLVTLITKISDLMLLSFTYRGKKITDKRREAVNELLAQILFYACALVYLNELDHDEFELDALTEFAEEFHPDYMQDSILCANQMLGHASQLMEKMFDHPDTEEVLEEADRKTAVKALDVPGVEESTSLVAAGEEGEPLPLPVGFESLLEDLEFVEGEPEQLLASIFAGVIILADRFDTDLGVVIFNAGTLEDI